MKASRRLIFCKRRYLFFYLPITLFKFGIHQLAIRLIKTNCNNDNTNKNQENFLVNLFLTNGLPTVPYSQYA